jgi:hypothetical protein
MDEDIHVEQHTRDWHAAARGRLRMELAGLALARKYGRSPEDFARHLWDEGAACWMGQTPPTPAQYLAKEIAAFRSLYPQVEFIVAQGDPRAAELTFCKGTCLGGWGKDQWSLARGLGLRKGHVCRYCREAFRVWSRQLGLSACTHPQSDGTCILRVDA